MRKKFPIFILILIVFGGLFGELSLYDNASLLEKTETTGVNLIVLFCGDGIAVPPYQECDPGNEDLGLAEDLAGESCVSLGYDGGELSCYPFSHEQECTFDILACYHEDPPPPPPPGGGGGGPPPPPTEAKVVLLGKAHPLSEVNVLLDGKMVTSVRADSSANFRAEITNITSGVYSFGLWAEDRAGRRSITFSFTATVSRDMTTTISNIFIPPTIELEKVGVLKGEDLIIMGATVPESQISVHVGSSQEIIKKTTAEKGGDWKHVFDTMILEEGGHTVRAKAEEPGGLLSSFSSVLSFYVGKYGSGEICPRADFNKDGRTDLIDFSIMLYWWGKYNPCVDQNQDGIVNLPDFSILMYWWTG